MHNSYKLTERQLSQKNLEDVSLNNSLLCSCSLNSTSFWLQIKQQWSLKENSISSNSGHLELIMRLSDTILKWDQRRTITAKFALTFHSSFRGEDLRTSGDIWWQKLTWSVGWKTASSLHYKWLVSNQTCELPCILTLYKELN